MDENLQIQCVYGLVKSININSKLLVINDQLTNRLITCRFDGFLPASESDVITGMIIKQEGSYIFYKKPLIKLSTDKDTIIKSIIKGLGHTIGNALATRIYENMLIYGEGLTVDEMLNTMAVDLHDKQIENFGVLCDYLQGNQVLKLLRYWYKSRTMRQLYLLGLNNTEIKKIEEMTQKTPTEIYEQCLINPFKIIPIPIDKCKQIFESIAKDYTDEDLYYATIVRKIYFNCQDKSWCGTPSKFIQDQFKGIKMEVLKRDYEIEGEFHTLYLKHHYKIEKTVAEILAGMIKLNEHKRDIIPEFKDSRLTDIQKNSVSISLNKQLTTILGEAGSGKSTVIAEIARNLERLNIPYAVAAFTGKAVAVNKEKLCNNIPMTLHMMISRHKQMAPFKFLIIDEAPMTPTELLYYIFKCFGTNFQLCLVGDENQLPPISWGNLFTEIINSKTFDSIILPKSHRCTVEDSLNDINFNARALIENYKQRKNSNEFVPPMEFRTGNNFFRLEGDITNILELVKLFHDQGVDPSKIIVITPYTKYLDDINRGIQKIYNIGKKTLVDERGINWSLGDKIMITSNNYNLNLMNGDEGIVIDLNTEIGKSGHRELFIQFKSGQVYKFDVTYDTEDFNLTIDTSGDNYTITNNPTLSLLTHSYAITVHKSQGSEYDFVIAYMPKNEKDNSFINFNLIYTWFTRPKVSIFLVGDLQAIDLACTREPPFRVDNLGKRLKVLLGENV